MKYYLIFLCTALLLSGCRKHPKEPATTLRLPITLKQGYGPFYPGFGILNADRTDDPVWSKTYYAVRGIPHHWSSVTKTRLCLDFQQFVYQQVKTGNLAQSVYDEYSQAPDWTANTARFSAKPIKCYINVVRGFDEHAGKWAVMVDTDNNLDFSNEIPVYPTPIQPKEIPDKIQNSRTIRYEIYQNEQVKTAYAPITFRYSGGTFLYNFPRHATAIVPLDGATQELVINPGLSRRDFKGSTIALSSSIGRNGRVDAQKLIKVGDEIKLGGVLYRNNGISPADNILELEPVDAAATRTNPLQNGHTFQPFTDTDFASGKPINLQHQQGKYVFIDFWHTGCKGCVEDMPNLNAIYQRVDKRKVEFIGINCGDKPERLRAFLQKKQVRWPQILSTTSNDYYRMYRVAAFPTSVLLDPTGKIIARDLHSSALDEKLTALVQP